MRNCSKCGKEYDPESFRVMVKKWRYPGPFMSFLCKECAKDESGVEIVEEVKP